jgi:hypothetical protein
MQAVNRGPNPFLCNHGFYATFAGPGGDSITLAVLCELLAGHSGDHAALEAGTWTNEKQ